MKCIKCGKEIGEEDLYCSGCGTKQVLVYRQVFTRINEFEGDFIARVNQWLQSDPRIANVKCYFDTRTGLGVMANTTKLKQITVDFELLESANSNVYCIVREESNTPFKRDADNFIRRWKENHPGTTVVTCTTAQHSWGYRESLLLGGVGAWNRTKVFILCKFPRR